MNLRSLTLSVLVAIAYAWLQAWLYATEVAMLWGYMGFGSRDLIEALAPLTLATIVTTALVPQRLDTRGVALTAIHYFFTLPSVVYAVMSEAHATYTALLYASVLTFTLVSGVRLPALRVRRFENREFVWLVLVVSGTLILAYAALSGIRSLSFDFEQIYQVRARNSESVPGLLGYSVSLISTILLPAVMIYSLESRRRSALALAIGLQVIFFGLTNFKEVLFAPILIVAFYLALARRPATWSFGLFFLTLPVVAAVQGRVARLFSEGVEAQFVTDLFIRRFLFVPPMLDENHVLFFTENPKFWWSTSKFSLGVTENPYGTTAPFVMGQELFGADDWAANTGMIGSGFSHAGIFGVLLYSVLFGLVLAIFNSQGRRLGHPLVASVTLLTILTVTRSSDFTTVLFTHGLVFLILMLAFLPARSSAPDLRTGKASTRLSEAVQ